MLKQEEILEMQPLGGSNVKIYWELVHSIYTTYAEILKHDEQNKTLETRPNTEWSGSH